MKKWYLSKTIWIGVLAVAAAGVEAYQSGLGWPAILLAVFGATTVALRAVTDESIVK